MSTKEIEALFNLLKDHNLTVGAFNDVVDYINKKIQEDKE